MHTYLAVEAAIPLSSGDVVGHIDTSSSEVARVRATLDGIVSDIRARKDLFQRPRFFFVFGFFAAGFFAFAVSVTILTGGVLLVENGGRAGFNYLAFIVGGGGGDEISFPLVN